MQRPKNPYSSKRNGHWAAYEKGVIDTLALCECCNCDCEVEPVEEKKDDTKKTSSKES